jgi:hypothetical protein
MMVVGLLELRTTLSSVSEDLAAKLSDIEPLDEAAGYTRSYG